MADLRVYRDARICLKHLGYAQRGPTSKKKEDKEKYNVTRILRKPPGFDAIRCGPAAACVCLPPYAFASDAPGSSGPSAPKVETGSTRSEIVSAERRDESIAKVPISIAAFSQKTMDNLHIGNFSDLASIVPGLTIEISV